MELVRVLACQCGPSVWRARVRLRTGQRQQWRPSCEPTGRGVGGKLAVSGARCARRTEKERQKVFTERFIQLAQRSTPPQKPGPHQFGSETRWLRASAAASAPQSGVCGIAGGRACKAASIEGGWDMADAHMAL